MVREPLDGWHERGCLGAALGAYVGLAGAVLKPASGLLECLAKTASGVGSTVRGWGEAPARPPLSAWAAVGVVGRSPGSLRPLRVPAP